MGKSFQPSEKTFNAGRMLPLSSVWLCIPEEGNQCQRLTQPSLRTACTLPSMRRHGGTIHRLREKGWTIEEGEVIREPFQKTLRRG